MTKDMTTGSPLKLILYFSIPVLIGNVFQQFYNMVDTLIVGRFLGEDALAAVGATGSICFMVLGFAIGIAQGFGIKMSHAFGARNEEELKSRVAASLSLGLIVSAVLTVLTMISARLLLRFMNTPENIFEMSYAYIIVIYGGLGATMFFNIASAILRGVGDSKTPLYFLVLASLLNIVLDIFLIVQVGMGTEGAAWATVISQAFSALLCFVYMFRKFEILKLKKRDFRLTLGICKSMFGVGIPMALNYTITAVGVMILQSAINVFGSTVVASYTAAAKVEQLATQPMVTLGTTMSTYNGQNLGAGHYDRIFDGMKKAFWVSLVLAALGALICCVGGMPLVSLFLSEPTAEILGYARQYLVTASCFFIPLVMIYLYRNALQGLDQGFWPMMSGLFEMVCRIGAVWILLKPAGFWAVCFASPTAWVGAGLPLLGVYLGWKKKMRNVH